jgi:hypothetical protein
LKEERKRTQEQNKKRKEQLKEEHKKKSLAGMHKKQKVEADAIMKKHGNDAQSEAVDDDVQYYREEVGEEPQPGMLSHLVFRKCNM